ncbi:hypothetical protein NPIL_695531 [Nephila pilipes]|uniref:Uncharacterized protein n=1 Tax=Nephila pilipes TaxID=299642 RepID=A0A8X6NT99_NEPPI|nr:hypothetical protein NPIL_695531 [Nephila pilipes]
MQTVASYQHCGSTLVHCLPAYSPLKFRAFSIFFSPLGCHTEILLCWLLFAFFVANTLYLPEKKPAVARYALMPLIPRFSQLTKSWPVPLYRKQPCALLAINHA